MFELTELPPAPQAPLAGQSLSRWLTLDGELTAEFYRRGDDFEIRFHDRADFTISLAEGRVFCVPVPGTSPQAVRDLYLNQVMPLIRGQQGEIVVHASAAAVAGEALGFAGATGRGKSTLAAAFASAGMPFLSDDGITLTRADGRYLAWPNRPSFRLWQDSQEAIGAWRAGDNGEGDEKVRVEANAAVPFQAEALPLRILYFLGPGDAPVPSFEVVPPRRALAELMNHAFLLDVGDRRLLQLHFEKLAGVAETVPCFALDYPRDYAELPRVIAAIREHSLNEETVP